MTVARSVADVLIPPSCALTAMSGPNARPPRRGSVLRPWTTGSPQWTTWRGCNRSATPSDRNTSRRCCASGLVLPNPFTPADEDAGYRDELSILQTEFSLTQMLDRPIPGRIFFEQVLHRSRLGGDPEPHT